MKLGTHISKSKPEDKSSGHGQDGNLPSEDDKPEHTPKKGDLKMKMEKKDFEKKVREMRRMVPSYSNGRKVVVLSEYSKKGQEVLSLASQWDGYTLNQIYDRWSEAKQQAYDEAWEMYCNSRHGNSFGICSHNTFGFTLSWLHDDGCTVLTRSTEYLVIFNE